MTALFIEILNMSLTASFVALAVILARFALKRAPKIFSYALWTLVLFRLVCPVSFESMISVMPIRSQAIPQDIVYVQTPNVQSGAVIPDAALNASLPTANPANSINPIQVWLEIGAYAWLLGVCAMLIYALVSYCRLKARLREATLVSGNLFETDRIESPFVLGFVKPKIYAPSGTGPMPAHILLHEQAHIRRRDYLIKPIAFLVLALHWFNPLVWLCYFLMARDMELSADEAALRAMGGEASARRGYCESLLNMATKRRTAVVPLAFGESGGGVKARIKNALNFKKPAAWIIAVAAIIVIALFAILVPNRAEEAPGTNISAGTYWLENASEQSRFERMISFTLNSDGTAVFNAPYISSYIPPQCTYAYENGELVFRANLGNPIESRFYGIDDRSVVARFSVIDKNTLVFLSSEVHLFAVQDGRYVLDPGSVNEAAASAPAPDHYDTTALLANKTPYVGDNVKVSKLVSLLPVPDAELIQRYISIGDDYGTSYNGVDPDGKTLTLYYEVKDSSVDAKALRQRIEARPASQYSNIGQWNALHLFCTIQNLEEVAFRVRFTPSNGALDKDAYSENWYTHRGISNQYCDTAKVYENDDHDELWKGFVNIERQRIPERMTLEDVRALAQIGPALTVGDFDRFEGVNVGSGFFIMRYEIEGGTLEVHADSAEPDSKPNYARFTKAGLDPMDQADSVDLMLIGEALEAYLAEDTASRDVNELLDTLEKAYFGRLVSSKAPPAGDAASELGASEEYRQLVQMDHTALPALSAVLETAEKGT